MDATQNDQVTLIDPTGTLHSLSPNQYRCWFLVALEQPQAHSALSAMLVSPTDLTRFESSLTAVVACCPALQLQVEQIGGQPRTRLFPGYSGRMTVVDLVQLPPATHPDVMARLQQRLHSETFEPTSPAWRVLLCRTALDHYCFYWVAHPLQAEPQDLLRFLDQWATYYKSGIPAGPGKTPDMNEPQRVAQSLPERDVSNRAWWEDYLKGVPGFRSPLPHQTQDLRVQSMAFNLSLEQSSHLQRLAEAAQVPLHELLLVLYRIWYFQIGQAPDSVIAVYPKPKRPADLVVSPSLCLERLLLQPNQTLSELLSAHTKLRATLETHAVNYAVLLASLKPLWLEGREPLAQVAFRDLALVSSQNVFRSVRPVSHHSRWDLELQITDLAPIRGVLLARTALFSADDAAAMIQSWNELLARVPEMSATELRDWPNLPAFGLPPTQQAPDQPYHPAPRPALTWVERELTLILFACSGIWINHRQQDLFAAGLDSLSALQLTRHIRNSFAVTLPFATCFASPTIAGLAQQLAKALDTAPVARGKGWQRRLRFDQQRNHWLSLSHGKTFNQHLQLQLGSDLDHRVLVQALETLCLKHPILLHGFGSDPCQPLQMEGLPQSYSGVTLNLLALDQLNTFKAQRFSSDKPPFRAGLLPQAGILILSFSDLIVDEVSLLILQADLEDLIRANLQASEVPCDPLPCSENEEEPEGSNHPCEAQLGYWQKQLENLPIRHSLPVTPFRTMPTCALAFHQIDLHVNQQAAFHHRCREWGVTLEMGLQAAFAVLLGRNSYQHDIFFSKFLQNRTSAQAANLVGPLANQVVLRYDLSQNPSFGRFLRQTRLVYLQACENGQVPFALVAEALEPVVTQNHPALSQILFKFEVNQDRENGDLLTPMICRPSHSPFELTLHLTAGPSGLQCLFAYHQERFQTEQIEQLVQQWTFLFASIYSNPEQRLHNLDLQPYETRASELRFLDRVPTNSKADLLAEGNPSIGSFIFQIKPKQNRNIKGSLFWQTKLDNCRVQILDRFGQPVAPGVVGELHIELDHLGAGCHWDLARTALYFIPNARSSRPGGRIIRSFRLAKRLEEGFELYQLPQNILPMGESWLHTDIIEAQLRAHPEIVEAAVTWHHDLGEPVVWVQTADHCTRPAEEYQTFLSKQLKAAQIPQTFWPIAQLPHLAELDPNGEANGPIDRDRLAQGCSGLAFAEPPSVNETKLLQIFAKLLGVSVQPNDSFFDLGGHSLLLPCLIARIEAYWGLTPPVDLLFRMPSPRALANQLDQMARALGLDPELQVPRNLKSPKAVAGEFVEDTQHRFAYHLFRPLFRAKLLWAFEKLKAEPVWDSQLKEESPLLWELSLYDISGLELPLQDSLAKRLIQDLYQVPSSRPSVRVALLILDAWDHQLLICFNRTRLDQALADHAVKQLFAYYNLRGASAQIEHLPTPGLRPKACLNPSDPGKTVDCLSTLFHQHQLLPLKVLAHFEGIGLALALHTLWLEVLSKHAQGEELALVCRLNLDPPSSNGSSLVLLRPGKLASDFRDNLHRVNQAWQEAFLPDVDGCERLNSFADQHPNSGPAWFVRAHAPNFCSMNPAARNLEVVRLVSPRRTSNWMFEVEWTAQENGLEAVLLYTRDLFSETSAKKLLGTLRQRIQDLWLTLF